MDAGRARGELSHGFRRREGPTLPVLGGTAMITLKSYLRGEWVEGRGELATLVNPTTGEAIAKAGSGGLDLGAALELARREGGPALRAMTFAERGAILKAMSAAIH